METKKTAVGDFFSELKLLAEGMRFSQYNESANLIDYICTKESIVLQWEKEQILNAHYRGYRNTIGTTEVSEQYYNEIYGN